MAEIGKLFIIFSLVLFVLGLLLIVSDKIPFLGRLPGDIFVKRDGLTIYFPLVTSILISIILTILLNLFLRR